MNFLAHAYLSFNDPGLLVGNMISDYVKGRKKFDLPEHVQKGIKLHRLIDQFTDDHNLTKTAKEFFRPAYRLYAGAFIDVFYDHFLAKDENIFSDEKTLKYFSAGVYQTLHENAEYLPERFLRMLPYMQKQDWLYNYRFTDGLQQSLEGLRRRALYIHESSTAFRIFEKHQDVLEGCYQKFFPELKLFCEAELRNLLLT